MQDGKFITEGTGAQFNVFFDGQPVQADEFLKIDYEALVSSVYVDGMKSDCYEVSKTINGNVATFTISYGDDEEFKFSVEQTIAQTSDFQQSEDDGCASSVVNSLGIAAIVLLGSVMILNRRRKSNEEKL